MKFALFLTQGTSLQLWSDRGWLNSGGMSSYRRWAEYFETVFFLTYGNHRDPQYRRSLPKNIQVLPQPIPMPSLVYSFLMPFFYFKSLKKTDLYFSAQTQGAWAAAIAKILFRKKFILRSGYQWTLSDFGGRVGKLKKIVAVLLERFCYQMADHIILTSDQAKRHVMSAYHIAPEKISMIRNPVETDLFKPLSDKKQSRNMIYVGRLEKEKGPMLLFEAMKGLDVSLSVYGSGSLEAELKNFSSQHGLDVTFFGNIPRERLPAAFHRSAIFVMPSEYENSPKALFEAMSCGLPVIATPVRGVDEILIHRENGFLCERTPSALRQAILEVLEDASLRKRMGERARDYILEHCDLDRKIEREIRIFEKVLQTKLTPSSLATQERDAGELDAETF